MRGPRGKERKRESTHGKVRIYEGVEEGTTEPGGFAVVLVLSIATSAINRGVKLARERVT